VDVEHAGIWAPATAIAWTPGGGLTDVSCRSASDCTAVGDIDTLKGVATQVHTTEADGVWGPPAADGGVGVSCTAAAQCTSVGFVDFCKSALICRGPSFFPTAAIERAGSWPQVPDAPSIRTVTSRSRSITVTWAPTTARRGPPISEYVAEAVRSTKVFSQGQWYVNTAVYLCASVRTSCTMTRVTNGKTYNVSVVAVNQVGASAPSATRRTVPRT
jgi:hypothetical protein